jgi:hypothetical protein
VFSYLHPFYAASFSKYGQPKYLEKSQGWLIERKIKGTAYRDAMGCYPLFLCNNWGNLLDDIQTLQDELISVSLVTSPFGNFDPKELKKYFDIFFPFKDHYVLDLTKPINSSISRRHREYSRSSLRNLTINIQTSPNIDLDEWVALYDCLIKKYNIHGIRKFSRESFAKQVSIPNTYYFRALYDGRAVGGSLFYLQSDVVYGHLAAFTAEGYNLHASYAIIWSAINFFSKLSHWIDFGGGTKTINGAIDGLVLFKKGWSNETRKSYFCGKILNSKIYAKLSEFKGTSNSNWFPAYRSGGGDY